MCDSSDRMRVERVELLRVGGNVCGGGGGRREGDGPPKNRLTQSDQPNSGCQTLGKFNRDQESHVAYSMHNA